MATAYLGLGSNLNNPRAQIESALQALSIHPDIELQTLASLYQTKAVGPGDQPDYINTVAQIETSLPPDALLRELQAIEQQQGRKRTGRWHARTLDLDILLYDNLEQDDVQLTIPHPRLGERNFVLYPLHEIAPELTLPTGKSVASLLAKCPSEGIVKIANAKL